MSFNATSSAPHIPRTVVTFPIAVSIAVLSPVAVTGNALILAAIWKKTIVRTSFHVLLSALSFTDLCTGLIAQPFFSASTLMYLANPRILRKEVLLTTIKTIGEGSAIYFISITLLLITLMSVERWLHMSRRPSRRGCFTVTILSVLIPIPMVVFCVFEFFCEKYESMSTNILITLMLSCYLTTSFAYYEVYRIIRNHQQQVQGNETSQNFGQQAIDMAKCKKSVASMICVLLLFSFCFIPFIALSGVRLTLTEKRLRMEVARDVSVFLLFLSSSLNPGLYLWRMKDIRNGVKQLFCRKD